MTKLTELEEKVLRSGSKVELCTVCRKFFSNTEIGDAHRIGSPGTKETRCLTTEEMRKKRQKNGKLFFKTKINAAGVEIWLKNKPEPTYYKDSKSSPETLGSQSREVS